MTKRARMAASAKPGFDHGPRLASMRADIAAVDASQPIVIVCSIKRLYGDRQGRWRGNVMELAPEGPVLSRKLFYFITIMRRTPLPEQILSATVRPFENQAEAMRFASSGLFAPGGPREWEGSVILSCHTDLGEMEIGVGRRNVQLLLHYFDLLRKRQDCGR